jgi:hypothetical protein
MHFSEQAIEQTHIVFMFVQLNNLHKESLPWMAIYRAVE